MVAFLAVPSSEGAGAGSEGIPTPFAVVELFTSEGCSSCPPADKLLGQMVDDSRSKGERLYPLAFHVDYWNSGGWKDRFSDPAYTRRQAEYIHGLGLGDAYTPQMIVNGQVEFVGSDAPRARRSIAEALKKPASVSIVLEAGPASDGRLPVDFSILGSSQGHLNVALVERDLITQVRGGENLGRLLKHENVVRAFQSLTPSSAGKGHIELSLPDGVKVDHASLIAYLQDPQGLAILGATSVDLK